MGQKHHHQKEFMNQTAALARSKFRARFKLDASDQAYIGRIGMEKISSHAGDFIRDRIAPGKPRNDGKQTPFKGHPVFKAQHATATCCRGCIQKWYGFPKGVQLGEEQRQFLVEQVVRWIQNQGETGKLKKVL